MRRLAVMIVALLILVPAIAADEAEHPAYTGSAFVVYNNGQHSFDPAAYVGAAEFVQYSLRDDLGRVGPAIAYLGPDHYQEDRKPIANITPTGFQNSQYDFIPGALYHRCHLIAHRMTGSGECAENLFTGTQYLNLGIMSRVEAQIDEYISRTRHHVIYRVAPDFLDGELVCRGVIIEALSVEDSEIDLCIYCFNVQPGVVIDYATGENTLAAYASSMPEFIAYIDDDDQAFTRFDVPEEEVVTYVLNTSRKRFHYPDCASVADIKPKNRQDYTGTRSVLISLGYKPCGACNP